MGVSGRHHIANSFATVLLLSTLLEPDPAVEMFFMGIAVVAGLVSASVCARIAARRRRNQDVAYFAGFLFGPVGLTYYALFVKALKQKQ